MTRALVASALLLAGCVADDGCGDDLARPPTPPTFAVVSSDYTSTAIGLLDADGTVLTASWVDSGTARPGIVAALSGDVVLPSAPFGPCNVVLVDRYGTDVVSWLDPCADEAVVGQVDVGSSFDSNPHDVLRVGGSAWVTRYRANPAAAPGAPDAGDDIAIVEGGRVARRIDLAAFGDGEARARPDRMARLGSPGEDVVVVGLARSSEDFMRAGVGAVAVVDPRTLEARLHFVDGLVACGEVDPVGDAVVVTCQGPPFADEEGRRPGAGVVAYRLEGGALVEVAAYRAVEHPDAPVPAGPTIPLAADAWITVAWGDVLEGRPDRLLSLTADEARVLLEASAFTLGDGTYDAAHDLVLVPDADAGVIRRLRADGTERASVDATGCHGLPPREVRRVLP
ncbi:MAG: hypothetical protein R3B82_24750 [Sandaracinaceae bacterium]